MSIEASTLEILEYISFLLIMNLGLKFATLNERSLLGGVSPPVVFIKHWIQI